MGFIYKITNTKSSKMYIGETKLDDPIKRWKGHLQSINRDAGCPALRDAIKKYGEGIFKFEVLIICFDEDRFFYEKEYIKKYNTQVPNGYNILPGGEGGGFLGKKHTSEALKKISESGKKFREKNPNHYETYRDYHIQKTKEANISERLKNSEKYKKAKEEKRVGANSHNNSEGITDDTKDKISDGLKSYFKGTTNGISNTEIHRQNVTKAIGKKVRQYDTNNKFIAEYNSLSEAYRATGVGNINIGHVINGRRITAGGYIWKEVKETELKDITS